MTVEPKYAKYYTEYLRICEKYGEVPNRSDFFGYLQGIAQNAPAMNRPDYSALYAYV